MSEITREQRAEIFAGGHPRLTLPIKVGKPCPRQPGDVIQLSSNVSIEIQGVARTKKGEWRLDYIVRDERPNLIRRVPPIHDARREAERSEPTGAELAVASHESSYTHSERDAITDAGEAPDADELRRQQVKADERWAAHRQETASEEERKRQERAVRQKLRETLPKMSPTAQTALLASVERLIEESAPELERAA